MDSNDDTLETRSICSNTSRASQRSSASAIAARARAKAEAARAQALFAQKEADMLKAQAYIEEDQQKAAAEAARKKAELQASLHTLRLESAAAAAIAEANVLEAAVENEFGELDRVSLKNEYVERNPSPEPHQNTQLPELMPTLMHQLPVDTDEISKYNLPVQRTSKLSQDATPYYPRTQSPCRTAPFKQEHSHSLNPSRDTYRHQTQSHDMRQYSSSYQPPQSHTGAARTDEPTSSSTTDLAKYLIRREMISSGLLRFDNQPENYWAWKQSFHSF